MKIKPGLKLRKIGNAYMVVDAADCDFTNVYTLNETAARIWELVEAGEQSAENIAQTIASEYDADACRVLEDVKTTLEQWTSQGLLIN